MDKPENAGRESTDAQPVLAVENVTKVFPGVVALSGDLLGAMVNMLLAQPPGDHDRAHRAWRALAPAAPAALCEPFRDRFGMRLVDGFGSTETNLVIGAGPDEWQVVAAHPGVAAVAAFAVPADLAEDEVMIAVVPRTGYSLDPAGLLDHCARDLPYFAVPRYVDLVAEFPVTATGKVAKAELRSRGVTATTWDSQARRSAR
jgi:acyl-CoA synthetase (AMP-forming)/AMP-acid ligase II